MRAGRMTYFFDVRETKAGDYYLTITESKKFTNDDGSFHYKKHKIYLYKEDFVEFKDHLADMVDFVIKAKGMKSLVNVIRKITIGKNTEQPQDGTPSFTDVSFEDI